MSKNSNNDREFYRISYRAPEQPIFEHGKSRYTVLDLSEAGVRFAISRKTQSALFAEGELVEGRIFFSGNRGIVTVRGNVIRSALNDVALRLEERARIPLARIMEEQMYLIRKGKL